MSVLARIQRIRALVALGDDAPLGDIALLKADLAGNDVRPELRAALDPVRGYLPTIDLDALAMLPPDSFGYALAAFMRTHGIRPFVLSDGIDPEMRRRNAYGIRYATTHDMVHVLLGFGIDWPGELGVLAFAVGQRYGRDVWVQAAFAWLLYPLWSGFRLGALWRAWTEGLAQGRRATFLLPVRLEERFAQPLDQLRAELGLLPPQGSCLDGGGSGAGGHGRAA